MLHEHKPLKSWWVSKITRGAHGKPDPVFDGDWSFKQRLKIRRIREESPDPKVSRLKMQVAMLLAERDKPTDTRSPKEIEIGRLVAELRHQQRTIRRIGNP